MGGSNNSNLLIITANTLIVFSMFPPISSIISNNLDKYNLRSDHEKKVRRTRTGREKS